jgi:hypothetical protein
VVTPSSPSPSRDQLVGVVLRGEYSLLESEWKSKTGAARQAAAPTSLILSSGSKSSSKLERDLDREVFSDRIESDPNRSGALQVEVALKTDILSICWARSGSSTSSRFSMKSSRELLRVDKEASGSLELARWLLKPQEPLATHIQEPKMRVVPRRAQR